MDSHDLDFTHLYLAAKIRFKNELGNKLESNLRYKCNLFNMILSFFRSASSRILRGFSYVLDSNSERHVLILRFVNLVAFLFLKSFQ